MRVGVPREVKNREYRVALTPAGVTELVRAGHEVLVEQGAGEGSSIPDADFTAAVMSGVANTTAKTPESNPLESLARAASAARAYSRSRWAVASASRRRCASSAARRGASTSRSYS